MLSRRVLITGGAGFLGSHLASRFRKEGFQVRLFDLAECPEWAGELGIERVRADIRDPTAVAVALDGVDTVVHAAFASPHQSREVIQSVNVGGTRNLCLGALAHGVRRLILISSTIVLKRRRVHPVLRNSPLTRLDSYRASRAAAEEVVLNEFGSKGRRVAIVRPKTFVGPGRLGAFGMIFEWIRLGSSVPVLGSGRNRYQLLDIRDMVEGIRLMEATDVEGPFYFGARDFRTVREDLQALLDHARTGARLRFIRGRVARVMLRGMELANIAPLSEWHYMSSREEDSVVDISRAERELGWRPAWSNTQALTESYDWYVTSMRATGVARRTHPVPPMHRVLKGLSWVLPRSE
jgi:nucleoside-diphosphate-sugar epimerase